MMACGRETYSKHTCFCSTRFLRPPGFQPSVDTLPASDYPGDSWGARCFIIVDSCKKLITWGIK